MQNDIGFRYAHKSTESEIEKSYISSDAGRGDGLESSIPKLVLGKFKTGDTFYFFPHGSLFNGIEE